MRRELIEMAADLARRGEPFALVTVVARRSPISAHVGDGAVVTRDGSFHGWVGGSCTRPAVAGEAAKALADGRPRRLVLDPEPGAREEDGAVVLPMTCHSGGRVEIHIQPVLPAPQLLVYGASPTARALARLAKAMDYRVVAVDPQADASLFPGVDARATAPGEVHTDKTAAPVYAVIATQGEWDEAAILAALVHEPGYLGVVASRKRFAEIRDALDGKASPDALGRIRNPAGLDLGGRRPEEVAVAILAEIVQQRAGAERRAAPSEAATARDPVCGMTVSIRAATQRAEHDGQPFYFCGPGCRERFLASPDRYLAVPGGV